MNSEEAYNVKYAGEVSLSGNSPFFTLKYIKNSEYHSAIYRIEDKKMVQITHNENERSPQFIDNKLYYIKYLKEKETLMVLNKLSEPEELASFYKIKTYKIYNDNIFIIATEKSDDTLPFEARQIKYRFNGRGLLRSKYSLYKINNKIEKIYSGDFDVTGIDINNNRIIIGTTQNKDDYGLSDLYEIDVGGKIKKRITDVPYHINGFAVSDSGKIAFSGHKGNTPWEINKIIFPEENMEIMAGNDSNNSVIGDSFLSSNYRLKFDNNDLYCLGQEKSLSFIYKINKKYEVEKLTEDNRNIIDFDFNHNLCYIYSTMKYPSIIKYKDNIYNVNDSITGIKAEKIELNGGEGFVMFNSKDSPSILFIHGGPQAAYGSTYFIELNYFYSNGYNILFSNPPGSTGYGGDYEKACVGDWGGLDLEFIKKFIDIVKEKYGINNSIGLTGGSYGGFMTNWIVGHTDMFKAAVSERSISNLLSMVGTSDIGFWFNTMQLNVNDPYSQESIKTLMEFSPISYVKNVKTPTLLITGEEDYRCPIEQAEQFFVALKLNNVDTELIRYVGDNHEHARAGMPKNMIDRLKRKLQWFDKYLK